MKILLVGYKDKYIMESEKLFREELAGTSGVDIHYFGWGYCNQELYEGRTLSDKIESIGGVDVILFSVFWKLDWVECFNKAEALKVSIAPDFYEGSYRIHKYKQHYRHMKFDVVFGYATIVMDYLEERGVGKYRYCLPFGVAPVFKNYNLQKTIDVLAAYAVKTREDNIFPYRIKIREIVTKMPIKSLIKGVRFDKLPVVTNQSRIVVNSNARFNFINPRVTETMACGTFLLTSYCDDLAKFGYKDGEHLVTFNNMDDFKDKVEYFLEHDKEREEIAENGMNFVRENYSNEKRIETLLGHIRNHL